MILITIRMKVPPEKHMELSQTIASLSGSIRMEKGCQCCDFCQSIEDENRLFLLEEWETHENFEDHLKSESFKVLRGAMNLLREPCEMMFHTVIPAGGDGGDLMEGGIDDRRIQEKDRRDNSRDNLPFYLQVYRRGL
jgi:quinol monooxygenase YgiN